MSQEDIKSSAMISTPFKSGETCGGYPTSTSIVYKVNLNLPSRYYLITILIVIIVD